MAYYTGSIISWNEFLIFDNFTVNFRIILKFIVLKKLYLCVCRCTNRIKGILMDSFFYSSSQYMQLK